LIDFSINVLHANSSTPLQSFNVPMSDPNTYTPDDANNKLYEIWRAAVTNNMQSTLLPRDLGSNQGLWWQRAWRRVHER
jgi:hypothetical protein